MGAAASPNQSYGTSNAVDKCYCQTDGNRARPVLRMLLEKS
jgi:hypothetical protein